jgi:hypothetical protein
MVFDMAQGKEEMIAQDCLMEGQDDDPTATKPKWRQKMCQSTCRDGKVKAKYK